jgi:excinuclease UvrABC nuclease subunit
MQANWSGYVFTVYPPNTNWNEVGGIYIFCGVNPQNQWVALYIGQADSFRNRIPSHEQWNPAVRLGATHIHALVVPSQIQRDAIERLLIQNHQPRLNVQHK